jgi:MFS family permease
MAGTGGGFSEPHPHSSVGTGGAPRSLGDALATATVSPSSEVPGPHRDDAPEEVEGAGGGAQSLRAVLFGGSPNVWRVVLFSFLINLSGAVWQASVWSPLLKTVFASNIYLGIIAAASGVGELTAAVLSGWGADRYGKERFVRGAAVVGALSVGAIAVGVHYEHLATLIVANLASGASYGAFFPCVEALLADSVPEGRRTFLYNVKYGLETSSYVAGYAVTLAMFAYFGNSWDVKVMKAVVYVGLGMSLCTTMLLFTIKERFTLKGLAREEAVAAASSASQARLLAAAGGGSSSASASSSSDDEADEDFTDHPVLQRAPGLVPQRWVPFIVAAKDLVVCLGSGMTTMYVSLFLIDDYDVAPMQLQGVLIGCSLCSVVCSQALGAANGDSGTCATPDGKPRFNRLRMMLVPFTVGVFGMFYLALVKSSALSTLAPTLVVYIVRSGVMNCMSGLSRAVLMDMVAEKNRAKWNVFESVSSVTWAGSAIIGGAISDRWDYRATFLITAVCHSAGWLVLALGSRNRDRPPKEVVEELLFGCEGVGDEEDAPPLSPDPGRVQ